MLCLARYIHVYLCHLYLVDKSLHDLFLLEFIAGYSISYLLFEILTSFSFSFHTFLDVVRSHTSC